MKLPSYRNNDLTRHQGLANKKPIIENRLLLLELLVNGGSIDSPNIVRYWHCSWLSLELYDKAPLLKISHTYDMIKVRFMGLGVSFLLNSFHSYGRCYAPKENIN